MKIIIDILNIFNILCRQFHINYSLLPMRPGAYWLAFEVMASHDVAAICECAARHFSPDKLLPQFVVQRAISAAGVIWHHGQ